MLEVAAAAAAALVVAFVAAATTGGPQSSVAGCFARAFHSAVALLRRPSSTHQTYRLLEQHGEPNSLSLERALRDLAELDLAMGRGGELWAQGLTEARGAVEAILRVEHRSLIPSAEPNWCVCLVPPGVAVWDASMRSPELKALEVVGKPCPLRVIPGGRTYETGLEHLALLHELRPYRTLLLGDSHIERFPKRVHGGAYFPLLEEAGGRALAAGVGGDGIAELSWRLREQRLLDGFPAPLHAVAVLIGSNDLLRGADPEAVAEATADLVLRHVAAHPAVAGASLLVLGVPPVRPGSEAAVRLETSRRRYNARLRSRLDDSAKASVVFRGALEEGQLCEQEAGTLDPTLFARDGVHLSPVGYGCLAAGLCSWLRSCGGAGEAGSS